MLLSREAEVWTATKSDGRHSLFLLILLSVRSPQRQLSTMGGGGAEANTPPLNPQTANSRRHPFPPPPSSLQESMPGLSPFPAAVQLSFSSPGHPVIPHRVEGAPGLCSQTPVPISESLRSQDPASTQRNSPGGIPQALSNT